ncbi:Uncharacterised protein [Salmonella enterica subsp. enterica]|uniref:Uncharacterized protein n=1 Tax=Salmonella enterica I TaxID=59201 RepID=A0A3S4KCW4_SALET|nr:Uncharacterised protein [Salmonella enterica subsp. enterica]
MRSMPSHYRLILASMSLFWGVPAAGKSTLLQLLTRAWGPATRRNSAQRSSAILAERIRLTPDYQRGAAACPPVQRHRCVIIYYWRRPMPATKGPFRHAASRRPRKICSKIVGLIAGSAKAVGLLSGGGTSSSGHRPRAVARCPRLMLLDEPTGGAGCDHRERKCWNYLPM